MLILSPLEQFQIVPLVTLTYMDKFDFSITNVFLISLITLICFSSIIHFSSSNKNSFNESSFFFVPNPWQIMVESIYDILSQLIFDLISKRSERYFPFITVLATYILFHN